MNFHATRTDDEAPSPSQEQSQRAFVRAESASALPVDEAEEPMWRPAMATDGQNGRRAVVSLVVFGIQALLIVGIAAGLAHKPAPFEYKPLEVALIPQEKEVEEEPPPPPPVLQQPQIVLNVITPPQIYTPPPLVELKNAPPPTITSQSVAPPPPRVDPNIAIQNFQMRLLREVNRNLRYPRQARQDLLEGIVQVRFSMDRSGNVSNIAIHEPSAFEALNLEAVAVLERASPFPAPPVELKGNPIDMILPVKFSLRGTGGHGGRRGPGGPRGPRPRDD